MSPLRFGLAALVLLFTLNAHALPSTAACVSWQQAATSGATDQVVVMRADGNVVYQWADGAYKVTSPHALWSVSKSITATLAATAIQQGRLKVTDRVATYLPNSLRSVGGDQPLYEKLTIDDLMSMTSGFKWNENANADPQDQSDLPMLYYSGYRDVVGYALAQTFTSAPGQVWNYSSLNADLIMGVLKHIYGRAYDQMPWDNLFLPLGLTSAHFEQDRAGNYVGAAYVHLSPIDLAKVGVLYLRDGVTLSGRRLLPAGWAAHAQSPVAVARGASVAYSHGSFWLNAESPGLRRTYLGAPVTTYMAEGVFGQILAIFPQAGLVVVRTGHDPSGATGNDTLISGALACFGGK